MSLDRAFVADLLRRRGERVRGREEKAQVGGGTPGLRRPRAARVDRRFGQQLRRQHCEPGG
jgi:hypothetical protein